MSGNNVPAAPEPSGDPKIDEVRADIAATRAELQDTVDALTDKLDVKKQAGKKVDEVKSEVRAKTPEPVQQAVETVSPYGKQLALGAAAAVVVLLIVRRLRR